jgi:hypothetical protein
VKRRCAFELRGGYPCNLDWPSSKATPGTPQWEAVIHRDMCEPCGDEVRRRHKKKDATPRPSDR